jgi:HEAT repeat protein
LESGAAVNSGLEDTGLMSDAKGFLDFVVRPAAQRLASEAEVENEPLDQMLIALAEPNTGYKAANALAKAGQRALPILIEALTYPDAKTRENAAFALGCVGPEAREAIPHLATMLEREPPEANGHCRACGAAAFALERIGLESNNSLLVLLCGDQPTKSRYAACVLGKAAATHPKLVPALLQALDDPREHVWASAALALGKVGPSARAAQASLRQHLREAGPEPAMTLAIALERIEPESGEGFALLLDVLESEDPGLRVMAISAIRSLWEFSGPPKRGRAAVEAEPPTQVVSALLHKLADPSAEVRIQVINCLEALPGTPESVLKGLSGALADVDRHVQNQAAVALALKGSQSIPYFTLALQSQTTSVRRWAAFGLGQLSDNQAQQDAVPLLSSALADAEPTVREAAAHACSEMAKRISYVGGVAQPSPAKDAVPALVNHLADPDADVCLEIALALSDLHATTSDAKCILREAAKDPDVPKEKHDRVTAAIRVGLE